jgi:hypothetical protein
VSDDGRGADIGDFEMRTLGASELGPGADDSSIAIGALVGIAVSWSTTVDVG